LAAAEEFSDINAEQPTVQTAKKRKRVPNSKYADGVTTATDSIDLLGELPTAPSSFSPETQPAPRMQQKQHLVNDNGRVFEGIDHQYLAYYANVKNSDY
jgi:hypothetical protein